jgi:hypothetical protein
MTHNTNTEVREFAAGDALTESELDKVSGGSSPTCTDIHALNDTLAVWDHLLGQLAFRSSGEWKDEDYDVLADGKVVGRILQENTSGPPELRWGWSITAIVRRHLRRTAPPRRAKRRWRGFERLGSVRWRRRSRPPQADQARSARCSAQSFPRTARRPAADIRRVGRGRQVPIGRWSPDRAARIHGRQATRRRSRAPTMTCRSHLVRRSRARCPLAD